MGIGCSTFLNQFYFFLFLHTAVSIIESELGQTIMEQIAISRHAMIWETWMTIASLCFQETFSHFISLAYELNEITLVLM